METLIYILTAFGSLIGLVGIYQNMKDVYEQKNKSL